MRCKLLKQIFQDDKLCGEQKGYADFLFSQVAFRNNHFPVATATPDFASIADTVWPLKTYDVIPGTGFAHDRGVLVSQQPLAFLFASNFAEPNPNYAIEFSKW